MSEYMAEEAPVTEEYIVFWKKAAQRFAEKTQKVDVPWVTFDGKELVQRYRPKVQHEIRFRDPNTGFFVRNIYQEASDKEDLLGKGSIGDVRLGMGVNGTHMNDASIVRMFHNQGRKDGKATTSIHDAVFTHINDLDWAEERLMKIYARAAESQQVKATLDALRRNGLPKEDYDEFLALAKEQGLIGTPLTAAEILRELAPGESRYAWGP